MTTTAEKLQDRLNRIVSFLTVKQHFQGLHAAWAATVVRIARGEDGAVIDGVVVADEATAPVQLELDGGSS